MSHDISKLDFFAAHALQGLLSNPNTLRDPNCVRDGSTFNEMLSQTAYEIAEKMLESNTDFNDDILKSEG